MKNIRGLLACSFLVLGLRASAVDSNVNELVLPEELYPQLDTILATAVRQSPRMLNQALTLEIAENNRIQARSNLLPTVGGYGNYYEARDTRADLSGRLSVTKIAYNVSINQPLFHWGERRNNDKMGEIQQNITKGQYRDAYRLLAQGLRGDFLRLIVQKLAAERAAFYLEHTKRQLALEEERLAKKVISEYQISPFRLAVEQAQLAIERAQFDLEMAKQSFARLSGAPVLRDDAIPNQIPSPAYKPDALKHLQADFLNLPELPTTEAVTMRQQMANEKLNYENAKTRLRPKFNFVAGISQDEQSYTINVAQKYQLNSQYAGVSASWTLFDGFSSRAAVRSALARTRQLDNDYKDLTERLQQNAQIQLKGLEFAARSMSIADRALVSSEGSLRTKQDEVNRGIASEVDVSVARIALYDARIYAFNCRMDVLLRTGDFLGLVAQDPIVANLPDVK